MVIEGIDAAVDQVTPMITKACTNAHDPALDAGKLGGLYNVTEAAALLEITYYG